jgi:hypothetical protein
MTAHHFKTTCQCPLYQTLHISYTNMSKLRPYHTNVHHINHCTLSMPVSTISKTALFLCKTTKIASPYKCPPYQNTTLCYTNMSKIASLYKCPSYQMTTLFLYKHVKIANTTLLLGRCPPYISYTHMSKLRP